MINEENQLKKLASLTPTELVELLVKLRNQEISDEYQNLIILESLIMTNGAKKRIRRISISNSNENKVGWVLSEDIDQCMICSSTFGLMLRKHHCRNCGNIICCSCLSTNVLLDYNCEPTTVCQQCYWGQETIENNTNLQSGLPIYVCNNFLRSLGSIMISTAESLLVVQTRKKIDSKRVYINICVSNQIPVNRHPTEENLIFMVLSSCYTSVEGSHVFNVVVRRDELNNRLHGRLFKDNFSPDQFKTLYDLCSQAISLITRTTLEELKSDFTIEPLRFFNHLLTRDENDQNSNSYLLTKNNYYDTKLINNEILNDMIVAVPSYEIFEKFYQLYLTIEDTKKVSNKPTNKYTKTSIKISTNDEKPYKPRISITDANISRIPTKTHENTSGFKPTLTKLFPDLNQPSDKENLTKPRNRSITESLNNEIHDAYEKTNAMKASSSSSVFSGETMEPEWRNSDIPMDLRSSISSTYSASYLNSKFSERKNGKKSSMLMSLSGSVNGVSNFNKKGKMEDDTSVSISKSILEGYNAREIIKEMSPIQILKLKQESLKNPKCLVGWMILLQNENLQITDNCVITGVRKNLLRRTEYRVSSPEMGDKWVYLSRRQDKKGLNFQPIQKLVKNCF